MADATVFLLATIPLMVFLGIRHGLDVDHVTAIDNLVRLHNAAKRARWVGTSFSAGHMVAVCVEMIVLVVIVKSLQDADTLSFYGGIIGAASLGTIGGINFYTMKKHGKTGSAIFASKIYGRINFLGLFGSGFVTGLAFGLGFDTATQISALTVSAVASATQGLSVAFILAAFFAVGMISTDTLDSVALRSIFARILDTNGFRFISYGLSAVALIIALSMSYSVIAGRYVLPEYTGPVLAVTVLVAGYGFVSRKQRPTIIRQEMAVAEHNRVS